MRGQMFSIEMIVSVSVFLVVFVFIVAFISLSGDNSYRDVQADSVFLANTVTQDNSMSLVRQGQLDPERYAQIATMDYVSLKQQLGLGSDFCIFVKDKDGNILSINIGGENFSEIGNGSAITIAGNPCGQ